MKFILTGLGNWAPAWKFVEAGVREAEIQGFWGVVFPDQYMWDPRDIGADSYEGIDHTLDTWIALTHLASLTQHIRLGTWVTPIPLRPPGVLAKIVSTLDLLSGGRTILGVGAGITQRMFEGYSEWDPPKVRVDKTKEGIELILRLWKEERVDFNGRHYQAKGAVLDPKPVQRPHPPLLFGGSGRRMLRLAGRYADICYVPPWNKMSHEEARIIVREEIRRRNREDKISFATAYTPLGPDQHYDRREYGREVERAANSGFDYFITAFSMDLPPWELGSSSLTKVTDSYVKWLKDFAQTFIPSYST